jgi:6-phosphogluconolactonase
VKQPTELRVVPDRVSLAEIGAEIFVAAAVQAIAARGRFLVALSGGSTPQDLFRRLTQPPFVTEVPWTAVHVFWGDERLVPPSNSGSNYYHARRQLLDHVPIPKVQVHRVRGELEADEAVADYTRILAASAESGRSWPRFDLALMGLGADGHTASLFPGAAAVAETEAPVKAVTADYEGRPAQRITLTPPVFNDGRELLFLVAGAGKASALAAVLSSRDDALTWPARAIQPQAGKLIWLADEEAAQLLQGTEWN